MGMRELVFPRSPLVGDMFQASTTETEWCVIWLGKHSVRLAGVEMTYKMYLQQESSIECRYMGSHSWRVINLTGAILADPFQMSIQAPLSPSSQPDNTEGLLSRTGKSLVEWVASFFRARNDGAGEAD